MDTAYCIEQLKALCAIDSPSGFTDRVGDYLMEELARLGYSPEKTRKGGVRVCLGEVGGNIAQGVAGAQGDALAAGHAHALEAAGGREDALPEAAVAHLLVVDDERDPLRRLRRVARDVRDDGGLATR